MKKLLTGAVLSLSVLAAIPVFAENKVVTEASARAESEQAIKELWATIKYREVLATTFTEMTKNLPAVMRQAASAGINGNGNLSAEEKQQKLAELEKSLPQSTAAMTALLTDPKLFDELETELLPLYSKYFTASEVRVMVAFYKTDVGIKSLRVLPHIMNESMMISQKIITPRITKLIEKLSEDAKK